MCSDTNNVPRIQKPLIYHRRFLAEIDIPPEGKVKGARHCYRLFLEDPKRPDVDIAASESGMRVTTLFGSSG